MAQYLPQQMVDGPDPLTVTTAPKPTNDMADLRVFWGPEICRLEYLVHLLETGRIKDPRWSIVEQ